MTGAMLLVGKTIGHYFLEKRLGEGGMGEVYAARHVELGRRCAMKILKADLKRDQEAIDRFFNEARAVNQIHHPNVVDVFDVGMDDGVAYLTMELLQGEDLGSRMTREGLTSNESCQIIVECCAALAASHAAGIIHRDLKPENIFLVQRPGRRFTVKLLDFGIAKLTRLEGNQVKTLTGAVFGTPHYSSPEQAAGDSKKVTPATDLYSLGVIFFELLTGRLPFEGETMTEILVGHMTTSPPRPTEINPHIPPAIEAIILQCLQKHPAERFASATALAEALRDPEKYAASLAGGSSIVATPPLRMRASKRELHAARTLQIRRSMPVPKRPPRFSRRELRSVAIGGFGAAGLLLLGAFAALWVPKLTAAPTIVITPPAISSSSGAGTKAIAGTSEIVLSTRPQNAVVWRGDERIGTTPLPLRLETTMTPFYVKMTLDGYDAKMVFVDPSASKLVEVDLERAPNATGDTKAHPKRPSSKPGASSTPAKPSSIEKRGADEDALIKVF